MDVGVSGPLPDTSATPELHKVAKDSMKKVMYPYEGHENMTLYELWHAVSGGEIYVLGSGSDYTAFVHNGIASVSTLPLGCP